MLLCFLLVSFSFFVVVLFSFPPSAFVSLSLFLFPFSSVAGRLVSVFSSVLGHFLVQFESAKTNPTHRHLTHSIRTITHDSIRSITNQYTPTETREKNKIQSNNNNNNNNNHTQQSDTTYQHTTNGNDSSVCHTIIEQYNRPVSPGHLAVLISFVRCFECPPLPPLPRPLIPPHHDHPP